MLASKWNRWLLVTGLAAGALAMACGEEDDTGGEETPLGNVDGGTPDAGGGLDAAMCQTFQGRTGALCADRLSFQECTNGVPSGPCISLLSQLPEAALSGEGGFTLPEAAIGQFLPEAGLFEGGLPDGALSNLPACGSAFECSSTSLVAGFAKSFTMGLGLCSKKGDAIGAPPTCTTTADCTTAGLANASCTMLPLVGMGCIQPCNPM